MSIASFQNIPLSVTTQGGFIPFTPATTVSEKNSCSKKLHRIATLRQNQSLSLAQCARRLGISLEEAEYQEQPTTDLPLSQLMAWKEILDVPFSELIGSDDEEEDELENPIRNRALLLKVMKTAKQILQVARETRVRRIGSTLVEQLVELMPELADVSAWPDVGQSHENRLPGMAAFRRFAPDVARHLED